MPEEALGIPSRSDYGDIERLKSTLGKPGVLSLLTSVHRALKAGRHSDIRLGSEDLGLYSWATKKDLPEAGKKIALHPQPIHAGSYKNWHGTIPAGEYGAGRVEKPVEYPVLLTKISPQAISFTVDKGRYTERYSLIRPKDPSEPWLMVNTTPSKGPEYTKDKYKVIPSDRIESTLKSLDPTSSVQAKIDGAQAVMSFVNGNVELFSPRISKVTNKPILYTEKVFGGRPAINIPPELKNQIVLGELYGLKDDKVLPPEQLSGLLNKSLTGSLTSQAENKIKLRAMLFNVAKSEKPYAERLKSLQKLKELNPELPLDVAESVNTPEEALQLHKLVSSGKHPLTEEGLIVHPETGIPQKIKYTEDPIDVTIRNVVEGSGKNKGGVGALEYSFEPEGEISGRVSSGLSDALRQELAENPEYFIGRTAKLLAQRPSAKGSLIAPSFLGFHEDK